MSTGSAVPEIKVDGLSKTYGTGQLVLQSVDLEVHKGEFVTLIGPSGCGKSTILKLISGLVAPTAGTIRVDGMTPKDARETISFIFQDPTLLPWRTVTSNVGLGLELEGRGRQASHWPRWTNCCDSWVSNKLGRPFRASFPAA